MRVLFLDTKPFNPNRYIARGVYDALVASPEVDSCVWAEYADVVPQAESGEFDLFIAFGGEEGDNAAVRAAARAVDRSVIWFTEDPYEAVANRRLAQAFDVVFSNDAASAAAYAALGARSHHLPLAADPIRNAFEITDALRPIDVFFAGTAWPNRVAFLEELRLRRPGLAIRTLLVANAALQPHLAPYVRRLGERLQFSPGVPIREFCRLASRATLTLTLPRRFATGAQQEDAASDTPGPRLFEVALAGSCQLVDAQTLPMARRVLEPGREFVGFDSVDDCIHAIDALLAAPGEARAIARAAQERVVAEHTYAHRIAALLAQVATLPARRLRAGIAPLPAGIGSGASAVATPLRPRVLVVTHNVSAFGGFGGAEVYLDRLREHAGDCELLILVPDRRGVHPGRYVLLDRALRQVEVIEVDVPYAAPLLIHPPLEYAFQRLLARHAIQVVHFNHLLGFPPSLPLHAKAAGCATLLTQHDHFLLCDSFTLTDVAGRHCGIDQRDRSACDACLAQRGIAPGSQARRTRAMRQVLAAIDRVLVGSDAALRLLTRVYPELADRCLRLPPPVNLPAQSPRRAAPDVRAPLRVVHLGNFTRFKGAETVLRVIEQCADAPIEFHIHGRVDAEFADALDALAATPAGQPPRVRVHGGYASGALPAALAQADVLLFLSTWPETYGITLSEAQAAGVVPIVSRLGAPAERVREGIDGFIVDPHDAVGVAQHLRHLAADRDRLTALRAQLPTAPGLSPQEFAGRMTTLYRAIAPLDGAAAADADAPRRGLSFEELGLFLTQPTWTQTDLDPGRRYGFKRPIRPLRFYVRRFVEVQREQGLRGAMAMARRRIGMALMPAR